MVRPISITNELTERYRREFDRLQAEQDACDQTIKFLIQLKANLSREASEVLDRLAAASVKPAHTVAVKR